MTCMILLITLHRSRFATKTVGQDDLGYAMEGTLREHPQLGVYRVTSHELNETTIEYVAYDAAYLPGDTPDDERRRIQIHYLDDDIESLADEEYYANRQDVEMTDEEDIPEILRQRQAQERKLRRANRE
eukprot:4214135-Amphidinium_carterae.1